MSWSFSQTLNVRLNDMINLLQICISFPQKKNSVHPCFQSAKSERPRPVERRHWLNDRASFVAVSSSD